MTTKKQLLIEKKDKSHNQLWEWEETPETVAAVKVLKASAAEVKRIESEF